MQINNENIKDLLRPFIRIFGKYFASFFAVLMLLVSVGQYKDHGSINLATSVTFAFPIALLGATIAAIFIGVFRKLEATPPWVQPSAYVEVNKDILNRELSKIIKKRRYLFIMFLLWLPYGAFIMALNLPLLLVFAYMAAMVILSQLLYFSKCPRCNNYFFYRSKPGSFGDTGNQQLNLLFGGGYRNTYSNKCLNCGLNIKNENGI